MIDWKSQLEEISIKKKKILTLNFSKYSKKQTRNHHILYILAYKKLKHMFGIKERVKIIGPLKVETCGT